MFFLANQDQSRATIRCNLTDSGEALFNNESFLLFPCGLTFNNISDNISVERLSFLEVLTSQPLTEDNITAATNILSNFQELNEKVRFEILNRASLLLLTLN